MFFSEHISTHDDRVDCEWPAACLQYVLLNFTLSSQLDFSMYIGLNK